jgi:hypothetical protein
MEGSKHRPVIEMADARTFTGYQDRFLAAAPLNAVDGAEVA